MIHKSTYIIAVNKNELILAEVKKKKEVSQLGKFVLNDENFEKTIQEISETIKGNRCRLLLDDNLTYLVTINLDSEKKADRKSIKGKIQELVPENLEKDSWDYSLITDKNQQQKALVFVPVQDIFMKLAKNLTQHGISLEAIEPVSISITRNSNPFIGLALKEDISGPDQNVLNILLKKEWFEEKEGNMLQLQKDNSKNKNDNDIKKKQKNVFKNKSKLYWMLPFFLLSVILLILLDRKNPKPYLPKIMPFLLPIYQDQTQNYIDNQHNQIGQEAYLDDNTQIVEQDKQEEVNLSDYSISILNGSGIPGLAQKAKELLIDQGFEDEQIVINNADSYNYQQTVIQHKSDLPDLVLIEIERGLSYDFSLIYEEQLTDEVDFDLVITLGQPSVE